jgi:hypothetical protein
MHRLIARQSPTRDINTDRDCSNTRKASADCCGRFGERVGGVSAVGETRSNSCVAPSESPSEIRTHKKRAIFEQLLAAFGGTPQQISNYSKLAEMVVIRWFLARWLGSFMERSAQVISPGVAIRGSHI